MFSCWSVTKSWKAVANSKQKVIFLVFLWTFIFTWYFVFSELSVPSPLQLRPCEIIVLNPWDESLRPFIRKPSELKCKEKVDFMYIDSQGLINFNVTLAKLHNLDLRSLKCVYQTIRRVDGDMQLLFGKERSLQPPAFIKSHVFRVRCSNLTDTVYDMAHFNPMWNENAKPDSLIESESPDKLSLIVFGIDSVSRSHAVRNLPKSLKFLTDAFHAYDFVGYRKVGENTWPNLAPTLTGKSHRSFTLAEILFVFSDMMPLIWNEKPTQHMATFFAEDRPDISSFRLGTNGFKKSPTDYFFRPYSLAMYEFEPVFISPLGESWWYCYGNREHFDLQVEYLKGFMRRYVNKRKLAWFWSNAAAHEDFTTLARNDDRLLQFLTWLYSTNMLENSILLMMSDHGFRIGGASLTHVGRAENNSPWLMMHVPKHVITRYPWINDTLVTNTRRLVTAYDIHETMVDILYNNVPKKSHISQVSNSLTKRSLFSNIPGDRTCADAGIEDKYCTCFAKTSVSTISKFSQLLAENLVDSIDGVLQNYKHECEKVQLLNITEVTVIYSNSDQLNLADEERNEKSALNLVKKSFLGGSDTNEERSGRYSVLFYTIPGEAYFEGTVDYDRYADVPNQLSVVGEPSRLNRYGTQSHCMSTSFLKQFCYCKHQL